MERSQSIQCCSLTRALYLELTSTMETKEFLGSLKCLIARQGRPQKIYSDKGRTFVGSMWCVRTVMEDERLQDFLASNRIRWQFNLSHALGWGGQFERIVGNPPSTKPLGKDACCGPSWRTSFWTWRWA